MNERRGRSTWFAVACVSVSVSVSLAACGGGDTFVLTENTVAPAATTTTLSPSVLDRTLIGALTAEEDDISVLVVGDSTGDNPEEWVFLAVRELADRFPAYTFLHHPWDDDEDDWGESRRVQQGTGELIVDVWNFSAPGKNTSYGLGDRYPVLLEIDPDHVVISHGKNEGRADSGSIRGQMLALTESLRADLPDAPITLVLQPPNRGDDEMAAKNEIYRELADDRGFGVVDVHEAFLSSPDPDALLREDGIHPTTAEDAPAPDASQLWADTFVAAEVAATAVAEVPVPEPSTLVVDEGEVVLTEDFERLSRDRLPAGWELVDATATADPAARFADPTAPDGAVMRLEATADELGGLRYQWSNEELELLRGTRITVAVRVFVEDGQPVTAGRIGFTDGVTVANSGNYAWARDGWHWRVLTFSVDPEAAFLRLWLYADTSTEEDGVDGFARFGRLTVVYGGVPRDLVND